MFWKRKLPWSKLTTCHNLKLYENKSVVPSSLPIKTSKQLNYEKKVSFYLFIVSKIVLKRDFLITVLRSH